MPLDAAQRDRLKGRLRGVWDRLDDEGRQFFWRQVNEKAMAGGLQPGSEDHAELYNIVREINPSMAPWDAHAGWKDDSFAKAASASVINASRKLLDTASFGLFDEAVSAANPEPVKQGLAIEEYLAAQHPTAAKVSGGVGTVLGLGTPLGITGGALRALPVVGRAMRALGTLGRAAETGANLPGLAGFGARLLGSAGQGALSFGAYEGLRDPDIGVTDPSAPEGWRNLPPGTDLPGGEQVPGRVTNALHGALFGAMSAPVMAAAHFITPKVQRVLGERLGSMIGGGIEFLGFGALPTAGHESLVSDLLAGRLDDFGKKALAEMLTGAIVKGIAPTPYVDPTKRPVTVEQAAESVRQGMEQVVQEVDAEVKGKTKAKDEQQQNDVDAAVEAMAPREEGGWTVFPIDEANSDRPYAFYGAAKDLEHGAMDPRTAKAAVRYDPETEEHVVVRMDGSEIQRFKTSAAARTAAELYVDKPEVKAEVDAPPPEAAPTPEPAPAPGAPAPTPAPAPATEPPPAEPPRRTSSGESQRYTRLRDEAARAAKPKHRKRWEQAARSAWSSLDNETRARIRAEQMAAGRPLAAWEAEAAPEPAPEATQPPASAGAAPAPAKPEARGTAVKARLIPGRNGLMIQPIDADGNRVGEPYPAGERHPERWAEPGREPHKPPPAPPAGPRPRPAEAPAPEAKTEEPKTKTEEPKAEPEADWDPADPKSWDAIAAEDASSKGAAPRPPEPAPEPERRPEPEAKPGAKAAAAEEPKGPVDTTITAADDLGTKDKNVLVTKEALEAEWAKLGFDVRGTLNVGLDPTKIKQAMVVTYKTLVYWAERAIHDGVRTYRWVYDKMQPTIEVIRKTSGELADRILAGLSHAWKRVRDYLRSKGDAADWPDEPAAGGDGRPKDAPLDNTTITKTEVEHLARLLVPALRKRLQETAAKGKLTDKEMRELVETLTNRDPETIADEMYDALEVAAQDRVVGKWRPDMSPKDVEGLLREAWDAEADMPIRKRTLEIAAKQQFSTPLPISVATAMLGAVRPGDRVMEPTAGTGNLVAVLRGAEGVKVDVREQDDRRLRMLKAAGWAEAEGGSAYDYLDGAQRRLEEYDLVAANFPWSASKPGTNEHKMGLADLNGRFAIQAARDLREGGRLVMVASETGMKDLRQLHERARLVPRVVIETPREWYKQKGAGAAAFIAVMDKVVAADTRYVEPVRVKVDSVEDLAREVRSALERFPRLKTEAKSVEPEGAAVQTIAAPKTVTNLAGQVSHTESERRELRHRAEHGFESPKIDRTGLTGTDFVNYQVASPDAARTTQSQHPSIVIETSALASVPRPKITYRLHPSTVALNRPRIGRGADGEEFQETVLSDAQLDGVAYAAQAASLGHGMVLAAEVGVGKSRIIGGLANELWHRGNKRILMIVEGPHAADQLIDEAFGPIYDTDTPLSTKDTAADYGTAPFKWGRPRDEFPNAKSRTDANDKQLRKGFGELGFKDGVLVVDSHNLPDFLESILEWGPTALVADEADLFRNVKDTTKARVMAWQRLHDQMMSLPSSANASFTYSTATPGAAVGQLEYLYGLRLWLPTTFTQYMREIKGDEARRPHVGAKPKRPVRAMDDDGDVHSDLSKRTRNLVRLSNGESEQIMREWKMRGRMWSVDLWRGGVEFKVDETQPTPEEEAYVERLAATAREIINLNKRFPMKDKGGKSRSPLSHIQNAMKLANSRLRITRGIKAAEVYLKSGHQIAVVMDLVTGGSKESGFWNAALGTISTGKVVRDPHTGAVIQQGTPEAVEAKARLAKIVQGPDFVGEGPIEAFKRHFGSEIVGAITGTGQYAVDKAAKKREAAKFNSGRTRIIMLSGVGKRGISLHHDRRAQTAAIDALGPAKGRRVMIFLDYDYRPAVFKQGMGRVDRTLQLTSPIISAISMGLPSEQKFLHMIASRFRGLGIVSGAQGGSKGAKDLEQFDMQGEFARYVMDQTWREFTKLRHEADSRGGKARPEPEGYSPTARLLPKEMGGGTLQDINARLEPSRADAEYIDPRDDFAIRSGFTRTQKIPDGFGGWDLVQVARDELSHFRDPVYEVGMALQVMPLKSAREFMKMYDKVEARERETDTGRAIIANEDEASSGKILRRITLDPMNRAEVVFVEREAPEVIWSVNHSTGRFSARYTGQITRQRVGILSGMFMHDERWQRAREFVRGANTSTSFIRFVDEKTGEAVSGARLLWPEEVAVGRMEGLASLYGGKLGGFLRTKAAAEADLRAGDGIPIRAPMRRTGTQPWTLRIVRGGATAGRLEIQHASRSDLSDRESGASMYPGLLEWHSGGTGRWLVAEPWAQNLDRIWERFPIDNSGVRTAGIPLANAEDISARSERRSMREALSGEEGSVDARKDAANDIQENC